MKIVRVKLPLRSLVSNRQMFTISVFTARTGKGHIRQLVGGSAGRCKLEREPRASVFSQSPPLRYPHRSQTTSEPPSCGTG